MKNAKWNSSLRWGLAILLLVAVVLIIINVSLNFTVLGCAALVLISIVCSGKLCELYDNGESIYGVKLRTPIINQNNGIVAAVAIVIFTILTVATLHNYFYADNIYKNNEHHALRVDGVVVEDPNGFILIKNDENAFFDDDAFHGSLVIDSYNNENVTLSYKDFTHPIFRIYKLSDVGKTYNFPRSSISDREDNKVYVIQNNQDDVIGFSEKDKVVFVNKNGEEIEFRIDEFDINKSLNPLEHSSDSAHYYFRMGGKEQKSKFNKLLVQGYSFNSVLDSVDIDTRHFDFSGINIVRQVADYKARNYEKSLCETTQYALEICNEAFEKGNNRISEIRIGDRTYVLKDKSKCSGTITIPMGKNIFVGYGNHKTRTFSFQCDPLSNKLIIKFNESIYRGINAVEGKRENTLYVTNSIIRDTENTNEDDSRSIGINVPNNVLSFDFFDHSSNKNMFNSFYLSFSAEETTKKMNFVWNDGVNSDTILVSNKETFPIYVKSDGDVSWIFKLENLRESTKFDSRKMMKVVIIVGLLSALLINFSGISNSRKKYNRITFSYVEFVAYIVVIYFVAFRCFLMWRSTVFRPLENISLLEWTTIFNNGSYYTWLLLSLSLFFCSIFIVKAFILWWGNKQNEKSGTTDVEIINGDSVYDFLERPLQSIIRLFDRIFYKLFKKRPLHNISQFFEKILNKLFRKKLSWKKIIIILYLFYFVFAVFVSSINSRAALLIIVLWYFLIDIVINSKCGHHVVLGSEDDGNYNAVASLIYTFINMIVAAASMIIDSGFMIMFLTFCIISFCLKLLDLYTRTADAKRSSSKINIKIILLYFFLFVSVFILLIFFRKIIILALNARFFILFVFILLAVIFWIICKIVGIPLFRLNKIRQGYRNIFVVLYVIIIGGLVLGLSAAIADVDMGKIFAKKSKSTYQRVLVQVYNDEPHKALIRFTDNDDELKFLQASHNHWIIEQYNKRSEDVKIYGERGEGFFKIQPQSKLGAMWNAQLSDIIVLRYVITEHGKWLPFVFMLLFVFMLYYGIKTTTYFRYSKSLLIQIPLLIFTQALLVWLANTQRFIFFGQDFPFISVASKIMLLYVFVLMTLWTVVAIMEAVMHRHRDGNDFEKLLDFNDRHSKDILYTFIVVSVIYFLVIKFQYGKSENKDSRYQMEALFEMTQPYMNVIDSLFTLYQNSEYLELKNNMHSEILAFDNVYGKTISEELRRLSTTLDTVKKEVIDSVTVVVKVDTIVSDDYRFMQRIWNNFVRRGSYNNSYTNILHVYKPDSILHISMRKDYYDLTLPHKHNEVWEGNIVESFVPKTPKAEIIGTNDYKYYQIPKDWVKEGQTYHMLKRTGNKDINVFSLSTNQIASIASSGIKQVMALYDNDDHISIENEIVELPLETRNYWARNILINGRRSLIYPAGEDLYWIRDFANVVKQVEEAKSSTLDKDVPITLDRELTAELHDILRESTIGIVDKNTDDTLAQRSVIVMDGNGHIKAMVDYKYGYELNPNDYEQIGKLSQELYMNIDGDRVSKESNYFENRNLAHLRGGPGSSQKPLVWTAVASSIDYKWKDLVLVKIDGTKVLETENRGNLSRSLYKIRKYHGNDVATFTSLGSDERVCLRSSKKLESAETEDIDLEHYLAYSSNYYSALMVYLGLHSSELYADKNFINTIGNSNDITHAFRMFKNPDSLSKDDYQMNYPFMKINGKYVVLGKPIVREKAGSPGYVNHLNNSVLHNQMTAFFGLKDAYKGGRDKGRLYDDYIITDSIEMIKKKGWRKKHVEKKKVYTASTMPAVSSINFDKFEHTKENNKDGWGYQHTNNIVRSIATGDGASWNVTPIKMAEMYGKMLTLDSTFCCTMNPNYKYAASDLSRIGAGNEGFKKSRPVMFESMNLFFTEGTGKGIKIKKGNKEKQIPTIEYNGRTYYLYGKTGTTNAINRSKDDYYSLLKIHFTQDRKIIKQGYEKVKEDKLYYNTNRAKIEKAYNVLMDEHKRKDYIEKELNKEHKRLAIVITDTMMHVGNAEPNKFYILYFTADYKNTKWLTHYGSIIGKVIESDCFQDYMNN